MSFHVPEKFRVKNGPYASSFIDGNNGLFEWGTIKGRIRIIASDGQSWEHVSVSFENRTPSWEEMYMVKNTFWDENDCVVQYHPRKENYVNFAKYCLHLWRPTKEALPEPPYWMVGPKEITHEAR